MKLDLTDVEQELHYPIEQELHYPHAKRLKMRDVTDYEHYEQSSCGP